MDVNLTYLYEDLPDKEKRQMLSNHIYTQLDYLNGRGRPPKWYISLVNYLHDNDIIHIMEGDSVWKNRLQIMGYYLSIDVDTLIHIHNYLMDNQ